MVGKSDLDPEFWPVQLPVAARRVGVAGGGISTLLFVFRVGLGETLTLLGGEVLESPLAQQNFAFLEPGMGGHFAPLGERLPAPCTSLGSLFGRERELVLIEYPRVPGAMLDAAHKLSQPPHPRHHTRGVGLSPLTSQGGN